MSLLTLVTLLPFKNIKNIENQAIQKINPRSYDREGGRVGVLLADDLVLVLDNDPQVVVHQLVHKVPAGQNPGGSRHGENGIAFGQRGGDFDFRKRFGVKTTKWVGRIASVESQDHN